MIKLVGNSFQNGHQKWERF